MKFFLFFAVAIATSAAVKYEEFSQRMALKTNKMQSNWKAGYNRYFQGWDMDKVKYLMGTKLDRVEGMPEKRVTPKAALPDTFDARDKWPQCASLKEIRDQSTCGSCWAVSSAEVATDRTCIASNGANTPEISAEDILECCSFCGYGCQGGYPIKAMQFWHSPGIVTGGNYGSGLGCQPYEIAPCTHNCQESSTPRCSKPQCSSGYQTAYSSDKQKGASFYYVTGGEAGIRQEIYNNGPVVAAFEVYEDFYDYKSGVYHHTHGGVVGGHAVKVLGWGTENGTPYWLVANSWNATWGMDGYFKIRRGNNECGFESQVVAGLAKQ